jgi:hypothetical protein
MGTILLLRASFRTRRQPSSSRISSPGSRDAIPPLRDEGGGDGCFGKNIPETVGEVALLALLPSDDPRLAVSPDPASAPQPARTIPAYVAERTTTMTYLIDTFIVYGK